MVVVSRLLLSVTLCLPYLAYAQAYKCIVNGASVFQQQPCTGGTKLDVPPPPDPNSRDGRIALAVAKKQVFIGMSEEEVVRSWASQTRSIEASTLATFMSSGSTSVEKSGTANTSTSRTECSVAFNRPSDA